MQPPRHPITIQEVTDPQELAKAQRQRKQFDENAAWLQNHIPSIYAQHRGKYICVAGKELFVGDSAAEVFHRPLQHIQTTMAGSRATFR
jgi:hypothetical protein